MAFDMSKALQSPGMAMAMGAAQNLGNPYGRQVDPMQAYQRSVMQRATLQQQDRSHQMRQQQAQRQNEMMKLRQQQEARAQATFDAPAERKIIKGADGFQYYADTAERVLPKIDEAAATNTAGLGNVNPRDFTADSISKYQESGNLSDLERYEPPVTIQGLRYRKGPNGTYVPIVPIDEVVENVADIAGAKVTGASEAGAQVDLPQLIDTTERNIAAVDALKNDPNLENIVGPVDTFVNKYTPFLTAETRGTLSRLNQIKAQSFLQGFQALKGSGTITEVEGAKGEAAIARLETAVDDKTFEAALDDLKEVLTSGLEVARKKAGGQSGAEGIGAWPAGTIDNGDGTYTLNGVIYGKK